MVARRDGVKSIFLDWTVILVVVVTLMFGSGYWLGSLVFGCVQPVPVTGASQLRSSVQLLDEQGKVELMDRFQHVLGNMSSRVETAERVLLKLQRLSAASQAAADTVAAPESPQDGSLAFAAAWHV